MFLEELNELFGENWSKFLTLRVSSFLKTVPGCRVARHKNKQNGGLTVSTNTCKKSSDSKKLISTNSLMKS